MKFTKQVNPTTREIRIIVTDDMWYGIQVFFRDGASTGTREDDTAELVIRSGWVLSPAEENAIINRVAEESVKRLPQGVVLPMFSDYLSIAE